MKEEMSGKFTTIYEYNPSSVIYTDAASEIPSLIASEDVSCTASCTGGACTGMCDAYCTGCTSCTSCTGCTNCESICTGCESCTSCTSACQRACQSGQCRACQSNCMRECEDNQNLVCTASSESSDRHLKSYLDLGDLKYTEIVSDTYESLTSYINKALKICKLSQYTFTIGDKPNKDLYDKIKEYAVKISSKTSSPGDVTRNKTVLSYEDHVKSYQDYMNNGLIPTSIPCCEVVNYQECISRENNG